VSTYRCAQISGATSKDLDLPVVMIDGIHFPDRVLLVALGIDTEGNKHVLGLREGSTEAAGVVQALLSELIERGLDTQRMRLWVIDGGKALRKAIVECFGAAALIQRCQEHKRRNVIEHLPRDLHASVGLSMRQAWLSTNAATAKKQLLGLASSLERTHPGAAASLREGLDQTLTVQGLGISGELYRVLRTTNPIENLNGLIGRYCHNVKRWKDGLMTLRWVASALSDAAVRFRRIKGRTEMGTLLAALEQRSPNHAQSTELKAA
jgi:transposase-like protein